MSDNEAPPIPQDLRSQIQHALNMHSAENGSNTPDFVLAAFLVGCLKAFDAAVAEREMFYGRGDEARVS